MNWGDMDFGQLSAAGVIVTVGLMVLRGWLVPRRVMVDRIADKDAELARVSKDSDDWQDAYLAERKTNDVQARQISDLIEGNKTSHAVLSALPKAMRNDD